MKIGTDWSLEAAWRGGANADPSELPRQPDGLQTLRDALIAMEAGLPLNAQTAAHLRSAFRAFLYEGRQDLTANLGLRPGKGRGYEAPLRHEEVTQRDAKIKRALTALGGNKPESREFLSDLLSADHLVLPECLGFAEPVMSMRQKAGGSTPISARQISRIASDQVAYTRKRRT